MSSFWSKFCRFMGTALNYSAACVWVNFELGFQHKLLAIFFFFLYGNLKLG